MRNPLPKVCRQGNGPRGPGQELEELVLHYAQVLGAIHDDVTGMSARPVQPLGWLSLQCVYRSQQQIVLVQRCLTSLFMLVSLLEHEPAPVGRGSPRVEGMPQFGRSVPAVEQIEILGHHSVAVHGPGQLGYDSLCRSVVPHRVGVGISYLSQHLGCVVLESPHRYGYGLRLQNG